jgi:hypothetical protein
MQKFILNTFFLRRIKMKVFSWLLISIMAIVFTGCSLTTLSLSGDSTAGLKQMLNGSWVSLDKTVKYTFDTNGGFVVNVNSVDKTKGTFTVTNGGIDMHVSQIYNGSWVNSSSDVVLNYLIFENGKKMVASQWNLYLKASGGFDISKRDGTYVQTTYESFTNGVDSSTLFDNAVDTIKINENTFTYICKAEANYTITSAAPWSAYIGASKSFYDFDNTYTVTSWDNNIISYSQVVANMRTKNGAAINSSATSGGGTMYYQILGSSSEGIALYQASIV